MSKKILFSVILLTSFTFLQNCIRHSSGGVSTSSIVLFSGKTITEAATNNGTFDETITATLEGSEFSDTLTDGTDFGAIDLPDGLAVTVTRLSSTKVSIHFSGQATQHSFCSNGQMTFYFAASAFKDGQLPISFEVPIAVQYISPVLTYSGFILDEDSATNDGQFLQTITVTAQNGGTFSIGSGVLVEDTDYFWTGLPSGLTSVITVNSTTQAVISFTGNATENTPVSDITAKLKFEASALSSDFCATLAKKDVDFKFYRSVLMYAVSTASGDLKGTATSARAGADAKCEAGKPGVPADYDGVRAFISTSLADDIVSMPTNYLISSKAVVEAVNVTNVSTKLADNWAGLLD